MKTLISYKGPVANMPELTDADGPLGKILLATQGIGWTVDACLAADTEDPNTAAKVSLTVNMTREVPSA